MKNSKHLLIVLALMSVIIVSAMNGILFITHPELTYGTPGMYHIAIIFMLIALGLIYLATKIELKFVVSKRKEKNIWSLIFNHQIVLVNIIVQIVFYLILTGQDVFEPIAAIIIPIIILLVSFLWLRTMKVLYLKADLYVTNIFVHLITNFIFILYTVYLAIQLFLHININ